MRGRGYFTEKLNVVRGLVFALAFVVFSLAPVFATKAAMRQLENPLDAGVGCITQFLPGTGIPGSTGVKICDFCVMAHQGGTAPSSQDFVPAFCSEHRLSFRAGLQSSGHRGTNHLDRLRGRAPPLS